jgi:hypothetical protein
VHGGFAVNRFLRSSSAEPPVPSLCQWRFQTRILVSGWIQGVCADILSHTWPVRGGYQPRTTPMPFQRISTDLCGSPDHPRRRAETAERATWGTKTPPPDPPQPVPHRVPARVRRKPRRWDPLVPIWGGLPGGGAPAAGALSPGLSSVAMSKAPHSTIGRKSNGTVRDRRCPRPAELVT